MIVALYMPIFKIFDLITEHSRRDGRPSGPAIVVQVERDFGPRLKGRQLRDEARTVIEPLGQQGHTRREAGVAKPGNPRGQPSYLVGLSSGRAAPGPSTTRGSSIRTRRTSHARSHPQGPGGERGRLHAHRAPRRHHHHRHPRRHRHPDLPEPAQKGYDSQAKSDARSLATIIETKFTDTSAYAAAADNAAVQAAHPSFKKSPNTTAVAVTLVDGTTGATSTSTTSGFCVQTTSQSGATFAYNSGLGGLQPGTSATCP
jgi:hypothetical protein